MNQPSGATKLMPAFIKKKGVSMPKTAGYRVGVVSDPDYQISSRYRP